MSLLRQPTNDEGCDVECGYCLRVHRTGTCSSCGYVRRCNECGNQATEFLWSDNGDGTGGAVFLCKPCADYAFEVQSDDARTP